MTTTLECPHCGATDGFMYREDHTVSCACEVGKILDGALQIGADWEHSPFGDVGTGADPFLDCGECGEGFPIPTGLKLNFVDRL